jgi:hypothetical protein
MAVPLVRDEATLSYRSFRLSRERHQPPSVGGRPTAKTKASPALVILVLWPLPVVPSARTALPTGNRRFVPKPAVTSYSPRTVTKIRRRGVGCAASPFQSVGAPNQWHPSVGRNRVRCSGSPLRHCEARDQIDRQILESAYVLLIGVQPGAGRSHIGLRQTDRRLLRYPATRLLSWPPPMDWDDNAAHMTDDAVRQQTRFGGGLGV